MNTFSSFTGSNAAVAESASSQGNTATPGFALVPEELYFDRLPRRRTDRVATIDCQPSCTAVPTSLSIDDASVHVSAFNMRNRRTAGNPRATLVDTPSIVDAAMVERRVAQIDAVMRELEQTENFWNNAELLLQDSWLNGYRGTFFEQRENLSEAAESYKRALKLYAVALKLDRLTAKSSPHIISFYYLLKRYANVLCDPRLPEELADQRTVRQLHEQMEIIRAERQKWGMINPELEDEPFSYAGTILKVLCT